MLIHSITNQKPRKTIGYCLENNGVYCFWNPRWRMLKTPRLNSAGKLGWTKKEPIRSPEIKKITLLITIAGLFSFNMKCDWSLISNQEKSILKKYKSIWHWVIWTIFFITNYQWDIKNVLQLKSFFSFHYPSNYPFSHGLFFRLTCL